MKKLLLVLAIALLAINQSLAQLGTAKKKQNDVSVDDIMKRVKESEEKRAYKPEEITPVYTPQQRAAILEQIRNAKKVEDLPIITTVVYYPAVGVTKLVTVTNGITDEQEVKWSRDEKLKVGDTIRVYGTYSLGEYVTGHVPSISDLTQVPYRNRLARITPNHNEKSLFISSASAERCLEHYGDKDIWRAYEGRKDTILLREEYLRQKQAPR